MNGAARAALAPNASAASVQTAHANTRGERLRRIPCPAAWRARFMIRLSRSGVERGLSESGNGLPPLRFGRSCPFALHPAVNALAAQQALDGVGGLGQR